MFHPQRTGSRTAGIVHPSGTATVWWFLKWYWRRCQDRSSKSPCIFPHVVRPILQRFFLLLEFMKTHIEWVWRRTFPWSSLGKNIYSNLGDFSIKTGLSHRSLHCIRSWDSLSVTGFRGHHLNPVLSCLSEFYFGLSQRSEVIARECVSVPHKRHWKLAH